MPSVPPLALVKALTKAKLNSNSTLRLNISLKPVLATELAPWALEVKECDDHMCAKDAHTQKLINASAAVRATHRSKKKDILSHSA